MDHEHDADVSGRRSRMRWVFLGFLAVAAFFLLTEHRAHVLGILPYLLLLACPLMHVFGHHRHAHREHTAGKERGGDGSAHKEG